MGVAALTIFLVDALSSQMIVDCCCANWRSCKVKQMHLTILAAEMAAWNSALAELGAVCVCVSDLCATAPSPGWML